MGGAYSHKELALHKPLFSGLTIWLYFDNTKALCIETKTWVIT